jgi:hypothetical protein
MARPRVIMSVRAAILIALISASFTDAAHGPQHVLIKVRRHAAPAVLLPCCVAAQQARSSACAARAFPPKHPTHPSSQQGGTVINHDRSFQADVLVSGQTIAAVGPHLEVGFVVAAVYPPTPAPPTNTPHPPPRTPHPQAPPGAKIIDASSHYVMPGGIDPHTHLDMPFMGQVACDDFYSGQAAALAGGTTMHIDFALPVDHDLQEGFKLWQVGQGVGSGGL